MFESSGIVLIMLVIQYVENNVIAFRINNKLWYLSVSHGYPTIYDDNLNKQIIPNIGSWFQAQTGHKHSYDSVCDMAAAFVCGMKCQYSHKDVIDFCRIFTKLAISYTFKTNRASEYCKSFWIEILDLKKIRTYASKLRDNFEDLRKKHGDEQLYNYLCRLRKISSSDSHAFDRLISRLGKVPQDPVYPDTSDLDEDLADYIINHYEFQYCKNISDDVVNNVRKLSSNF